MPPIKSILWVSAAILFCLVPLALMQTSGIASAGVSAGVRMVLEHTAFLLLLFVVGTATALLPRDAWVAVPIACLLLTSIGAVVAWPTAHPLPIPLLLIGLLGFGLLCGLQRQRMVLLVTLLSASLGFHMGYAFLTHLPANTAPLFTLCGVLCSMTLIFAIALAFGVTLLGDHEARVQAWQKRKLLRLLIG